MHYQIHVEVAAIVFILPTCMLTTIYCIDTGNATDLHARVTITK